MTAWGQMTDLVLALLAEHGRMTAGELRAETGAAVNTMSKTLAALCRATPRQPQRARIVAWVFDAEGERRYPRAVYALGRGAHAPKPEADHLAVKRRYWARRRARLQAASVFRLGAPSSEVMR